MNWNILLMNMLMYGSEVFLIVVVLWFIVGYLKSELIGDEFPKAGNKLALSLFIVGLAGVVTFRYIPLKKGGVTTILSGFWYFSLFLLIAGVALFLLINLTQILSFFAKLNSLLSKKTLLPFEVIKKISRRIRFQRSIDTTDSTWPPLNSFEFQRRLHILQVRGQIIEQLENFSGLMVRYIQIKGDIKSLQYKLDSLPQNYKKLKAVKESFRHLLKEHSPLTNNDIDCKKFLERIVKELWEKIAASKKEITDKTLKQFIELVNLIFYWECTNIGSEEHYVDLLNAFVSHTQKLWEEEQEHIEEYHKIHNNLMEKCKELIRIKSDLIITYYQLMQFLEKYKNSEFLPQGFTLNSFKNIEVIIQNLEFPEKCNAPVKTSEEDEQKRGCDHDGDDKEIYQLIELLKQHIESIRKLETEKVKDWLPEELTRLNHSAKKLNESIVLLKKLVLAVKNEAEKRQTNFVKSTKNFIDEVEKLWYEGKDLIKQYEKFLLEHSGNESELDKLEKAIELEIKIRAALMEIKNIGEIIE